MTGEFAVDQILVRSTALLPRPAADNGFFDPLCVEPEQSVRWLPQSNGDAATFGAPFLGLLADLDPGTFVGDQLTLKLTAVRSPSGSGAYSLWRDGFPPTFHLSSCDGVDPADVLVLPIGHDHFNMGFSEAGHWQIDYSVTGRLAGEETTHTANVTVHYLLQ